MRLGEFIINAKKKNQFEDTVFNRNLSNREISGWQYLWGLCHPYPLQKT